MLAKVAAMYAAWYFSIREESLCCVLKGLGSLEIGY